VLKSDYRQLEEEESYQTFKTSKMSPRTYELYSHAIHDFLVSTGLDSYNKLVSLDRKDIQSRLMAWIRSNIERGLKAESVRTNLAGIERFFDVNDVIYNKKLVRLQVPSDDQIPGGDVPFTNEDVQSMLSCTTSLRTKALIHFFASTGARPASIIDPVLRKKHIVDMPDGCKAVQIYEGSKSGYWAFLTPEASKALEDYFKSRKLNGEKLDDDSPVFVNVQNATHIKKPYLSGESLKDILHNLMKKAAIDRTKKGNRFDKAVTYGFRKRYNTILKIDNEVNSNIAEKLMGHKKGLDGSYLKPTRQECFVEFAKAIPELSIDKAEKLRLEKLAQDKKISELEAAQKKSAEFELELEKVKMEIARLAAAQAKQTSKKDA